MRLRNLDLVGAICLAVAATGWALLPNRPLLVGILLAVPLVFFLPGYTLCQVFIRKRSAPPTSSTGLILQPGLKIDRPLGAVDLLVFSLGLSLVIDIIIGFLLNLLPVGLQWQSWTLSLGLVTEVFALLAVLLRWKQVSPVKSKGAAWGRARLLKDGALLASALIVATLALWLAIVRPPQPQPSFTQFWMLPSGAGKSCAVLIGMQSFETAPLVYRVEVTSNGKQVASWPSITLATQQQWNQQLHVSPAGPTVDAVIDARLYRHDQPGTIYREVHVTLHGCGNTP